MFDGDGYYHAEQLTFPGVTCVSINNSTHPLISIANQSWAILVCGHHLSTCPGIPGELLQKASRSFYAAISIAQGNTILAWASLLLGWNHEDTPSGGTYREYSIHGAWCHKLHAIIIRQVNLPADKDTPNVVPHGEEW